MNARTLFACVLTLSALACSDEDATTSPGQHDAGAESGQDALPPDAADAAPDAADDTVDAAADAPGSGAAELLAAHLTGRFDSEAQSLSDPAYFAIQLVTCPISVPDLGERVLYVEQARLDSTDQPYRQRIYVIEPLDPHETKAVSNVFELVDPASAVGLCDDPSSLVLTADAAIERAGCAVEMEWLGDRFEGGTVGKDCESTLNGATYATSNVTLTQDTLTSWDQGWNAQDQQVWGATDGPYVFDRKTPYEAP